MSDGVTICWFVGWLTVSAPFHHTTPHHTNQIHTIRFVPGTHPVPGGGRILQALRLGGAGK